MGRSRSPRRKRHKSVARCPKRSKKYKSLLRNPSTFPCRLKKTIFQNPEEYAEYDELRKAQKSIASYRRSKRKAMAKAFTDAMKKEEDPPERKSRKRLRKMAAVHFDLT